MGTHYFNLDYGNKTACKKDMPLMLLYIDNNLNGFAWQHMAPLNTTGTDWEIFNIKAKLYIPNTVNTDSGIYNIQKLLFVCFLPWKYGKATFKSRILYRVRKSFPESRAFQYPEKTIAGTETNHTSAESTVSQLSFGTLKVGVASSWGCHPLLPQNNFLPHAHLCFSRREGVAPSW